MKRKMKCPKCGSNKAKYKISRKQHWGKHKKAKEPRKDFTANCPDCGHEFDASKHYDVVDRLIEKEPEVKWAPSTAKDRKER